MTAIKEPSNVACVGLAKQAMSSIQAMAEDAINVVANDVAESTVLLRRITAVKAGFNRDITNSIVKAPIQGNTIFGASFNELLREQAEAIEKFAVLQRFVTNPEPSQGHSRFRKPLPTPPPPPPPSKGMGRSRYTFCGPRESTQQARGPQTKWGSFPAKKQQGK